MQKIWAFPGFFCRRLGRCAQNSCQSELYLREPEVMLTHTPRIPGTDGRKMSKSYGNAIMLSESDETIWEKIRPMMTDPPASAAPIPATPTFAPYTIGTNFFRRRRRWHGRPTAAAQRGIGCIECKRAMADNLIKWIAPVRARRQEYEAHPARVLEILDAGSKRARKTASADDGARSRSRFSAGKPNAQSFAQPAGAAQARSRGVAYGTDARKPQRPYKVHLPAYEGPLDLLLDLIRKQEMDIHNIPIAQITGQYLEYLHKLEELDVDVSADFIYMAATLILIKSKMLLPPDPLASRGRAS